MTVSLTTLFLTRVLCSGMGPTECQGKDCVSLQKALARVAPGFSVVSREDVSWTCRNLFAGEPSQVQPRCPGVVAGDFNGDGLVDYALLLFRRKEPPSGRSRRVASAPRATSTFGYAEVRIMVLMSTSVSGFVLANLPNRDGRGISYPVSRQLRSVARGSTIRSYDGKETVILANPAFSSVACESSEVIYFWDVKRKSFRRMWEGD